MPVAVMADMGSYTRARPRINARESADHETREPARRLGATRARLARSRVPDGHSSEAEASRDRLRLVVYCWRKFAHCFSATHPAVDPWIELLLRACEAPEAFGYPTAASRPETTVKATDRRLRPSETPSAPGSRARPQWLVRTRVDRRLGDADPVDAVQRNDLGAPEPSGRGRRARRGPSRARNLTSPFPGPSGHESRREGRCGRAGSPRSRSGTRCGGRGRAWRARAVSEVRGRLSVANH